jgi:hypothetical protein
MAEPNNPSQRAGRRCGLAEVCCLPRRPGMPKGAVTSPSAMPGYRRRRFSAVTPGRGGSAASTTPGAVPAPKRPPPCPGRVTMRAAPPGVRWQGELPSGGQGAGRRVLAYMAFCEGRHDRLEASPDEPPTIKHGTPSPTSWHQKAGGLSRTSAPGTASAARSSAGAGSSPAGRGNSCTRVGERAVEGDGWLRPLPVQQNKQEHANSFARLNRQAACRRPSSHPLRRQPALGLGQLLHRGRGAGAGGIAVGAADVLAAGTLGRGLPQSTPAERADGVGLAPVTHLAFSLASPGRARENAGRGHRIARGPATASTPVASTAGVGPVYLSRPGWLPSRGTVCKAAAQLTGKRSRQVGRPHQDCRLGLRAEGRIGWHTCGGSVPAPATQ